MIEYLHDAAMPRLRSQIYGSVVPRELALPASFAGENFALAAFARLALQAARVDVDLWSFGSETGNSILVRRDLHSGNLHVLCAVLVLRAASTESTCALLHMFRTRHHEILHRCFCQSATDCA